MKQECLVLVPKKIWHDGNVGDVFEIEHVRLSLFRSKELNELLCRKDSLGRNEISVLVEYCWKWVRVKRRSVLQETKKFFIMSCELPP